MASFDCTLENEKSGRCLPKAKLIFVLAKCDFIQFATRASKKNAVTLKKMNHLWNCGCDQM